MRASELDQKRHYPNFPEFKRYRIDLSLTQANTIFTLQQIRNMGKFSIFPGPLQNNWGRNYGSERSEHYAIGKLATAGDVFPARGMAFRFWILAQQQPYIGGLGLYLNTNGPDGKPWIMVHFDLRPGKRVLWIRDESGKYWYESSSPARFCACLKKVIDREVLK